MKIPDVPGPEPDSLAEFTAKERKAPVIDWYRTSMPGRISLPCTKRAT